MKTNRKSLILLFVDFFVLSPLLAKAKQKPNRSASVQVKIYFWTMKYLGPENIFSLVAVNRTVNSTAPARAALEALIEGPTTEEKSRGLVTPYADDLVIKSLVIRNGKAYVSFRSGCSNCLRWPGDMAPGTFRAAIEGTLKQFKGVGEVKICLDGRADFDGGGESPKRCK